VPAHKGKSAFKRETPPRTPVIKRNDQGRSACGGGKKGPDKKAKGAKKTPVKKAPVKKQQKQENHQQLQQMLHAAMQVSIMPNPSVWEPVTVPQAQKRKVGVASTVTQDAPKKPRA